MGEPKYFDSFNGLRAIFCMIIAVYHVNGAFSSAFAEWLGPVYRHGGYFGNYMFFMISGFLIAYRYKERILGQACSFPTFMAKRILPVYPIYLLSNLFMMLIKIPQVTVKRTLSTLFMVSNGWFSGSDMPYNFPAWFLCVLTLCYILYFFLCVVSRKYPKLYLPLCCGLMIGGMLLEKGDWNIPFCYRTCGEAYMNFFLGAMVENILIEKEKRVVSVSYMFFALALVSIRIFGMSALPGDMRWWVSGICAGLICVAVCGKYPAKFLSCKPLQVIGKCSRSVFLWHIPVANAYLLLAEKIHFAAPPKVNFLLFFPIMLAFSGLSHYCLEKPWSRWLNARINSPSKSAGDLVPR